MKKYFKKYLSLAAFLFAASFSGYGAHWSSVRDNFKFPIPSPGWMTTDVNAGMVKYETRSRDGLKTIAIMVVDVGNVADQEYFVKHFSNKYFENGNGDGKIEKLTLANRPAFRLKDTAVIGGKVMHRTDTLLFDNGKLYQLNATSREGDPLDDPILKKCVDGFEFINSVAPQAREKNSSSPAASSAKSKSRPADADHMPELIADITFYALIAIVVLYAFKKMIKR
jgi:hypothetical protein